MKRWLNIRKYFQFRPNFKKMNKLASDNFFVSKHSHFHDDGTKLKIPSEIIPPLEIYVKHLNIYNSYYSYLYDEWLIVLR